MNFFCEYDKKPATAFCFQGAKKLAVCKEHIEDCLSKKLDIYPLEAQRVPFRWHSLHYLPC